MSPRATPQQARTVDKAIPPVSIAAAGRPDADAVATAARNEILALYPVARRVRGIVEAIEAFRRAATEAMGLGLTDINALLELWFHGPRTTTALAGRMGLTSPSVTALVDRLEATGLAARRRHPTDRRSVLIELTDIGVVRLQTITGVVDTQIAAAVRNVAPEHLPEFDKLLDQIAVRVRAGATDPVVIAAALGNLDPPSLPEHEDLDPPGTPDPPRSTAPPSSAD
jgi:DNA-binding MarR family transcriptional regulator